MKKDNTALRIAYVLDDGLDSEDGVQQYIRALGAWFSSQGHEVHYLVGETKRSDIPNVHSLAKNIKVNFNGNALTIPLPASTRKIRQILETLKLDVIHVQVPYSPFFGAKVVKLAKADTVVVGTFHILPYGFLAKIGTRALGVLLSRNLRRFNYHLAVSDAAKEFSEKTFRIHPFVLPNVVDISRFKPSKTYRRTNNKLKLLFLGRLVERKGCSYLLDALGAVAKMHPELDFELTVCGKGELLAELEEKSKKLGINQKVHFTGFVSEKEKVEYMQGADIAIFPSYAGESFGIVLLEAMAAGAGVVLGGNNPGYRSVIGGTKESLVEVRNVEIFAEQLAKTMADEKLRSNIHEQQQELVKQYDINLVGKDLFEIYSKIAKKQGLINNTFKA